MRALLFLSFVYCYATGAMASGFKVDDLFQLVQSRQITSLEALLAQLPAELTSL